MILDDCFKSAGPGRVSLPYLPGGLRKTADPSRGGGSGVPFSIFFDFFRMQKNVEKTERQKFTFSTIFGDFRSPRRRFLAIFGPKTAPRRLRFRCCFENGDFEGSDLPKIGPESDSERRRRETQP